MAILATSSDSYLATFSKIVIKNGQFGYFGYFLKSVAILATFSKKVANLARFD